MRTKEFVSHEEVGCYDLLGLDVRLRGTQPDGPLHVDPGGHQSRSEDKVIQGGITYKGIGLDDPGQAFQDPGVSLRYKIQKLFTSDYSCSCHNGSC